MIILSKKKKSLAAHDFLAVIYLQVVQTVQFEGIAEGELSAPVI